MELLSYFKHDFSFRNTKKCAAFIFLSVMIFFTAGCEKEVHLNLNEPVEKIIVEGSIETGAPPLIFLTRNSSIFSSTHLDTLQKLFVHKAIIKVSDGSKTVTLQEFSYTDPESQFIFYVYTDPTFQMLGKEGNTYSLSITAGDDTLSAVTTIPGAVPLDTLFFEPFTGSDSLVLLRTIYHDPDTIGNFARYFTQRVSKDPVFYPNLFNSVFDDQFVNGERVEFVLERGQPRTINMDWSSYGLFSRGDTVIVKWCMIDRAHYDFWRSAEQQKNTSDNPFSTPALIISNIKGGLGIWGGYSVSLDTLVISK